MQIPTMFRALIAPLAAVALIAACGDDDDGMDPDIQDEYAQVDRIGLPAIATVFIPSDQKDDYNEASPSGDEATYTDEIVAQLVDFGQDSTSAVGLADALLPDILPIDPSQPTQFLNGRALDDDVITAELMLIFGQNPALNDDNVDSNDATFLNVFPYLAPPWL